MIIALDFYRLARVILKTVAEGVNKDCALKVFIAFLDFDFPFDYGNDVSVFIRENLLVTFFFNLVKLDVNPVLCFSFYRLARRIASVGINTVPQTDLLLTEQIVVNR